MKPIKLSHKLLILYLIHKRQSKSFTYGILATNPKSKGKQHCNILLIRFIINIASLIIYFLICFINSRSMEEPEF